jgi:calcineurin-like phosphoesterase family protein
MKVGLIVPDVHEKIVKLKRLLEYYDDVAWVIFLGDFLDSWDGLTEQTHETIKWLTENVHNEKYTFLLGNHDIHYAYPIEGIICSGYTRAKQKLVSASLNSKHWNRFQLIAWAEGWLCSHAGLHPYTLPVQGYAPAVLKAEEDDTLWKLRYAQQISPWILPGRGRGGSGRVGGVDWLDWSQEFEPIEGLNQIVGHSFREHVRTRDTAGSRNYCIDTDLNHVALIEEGGGIKIEEFV